MMEINAKTDLSKLEEPIFLHVGLLVKDLKKTVEFMSVLPGISKWKFLNFSFNKEDMIVGEPAYTKMAIATLGGITFEIVEAINSPNTVQAQVPLKRDGFHHIAYIYQKSLEKIKEKMKEKGYKIVWGAKLGNGHVYYFAPEDEYGTVVEILDLYPDI